MAEIVALYGGEVIAAAEPRDHVIEMLEQLLDEARSGKIQAVGVVVLESDRLTRWDAAGLTGSTHSLIGAAFQLLRHLSERTASE